MIVDAKGEKVNSDSQNNFFLNSNNIIYYNDKTLKTRVFVKDEESLIWNKNAEKIEVLGFSCKSATTHFRGRDYVAYYTEEIPYKYGPWKFRGLEGLILLVKSLDGNYEFLATDYKDDSYNFNKPISSLLENKEFINYNDYVNIYKEHVNSYIKEQYCNCSEDGKNVLKIKKIEKVYSPLHDEGIVY